MAGYSSQHSASRMDEIIDLLDSAEGPQRRALLEEAIALPDCAYNPALAIILRIELIDCLKDEPQQELKLFNWCLQTWDSGVELRESTERSIMWRYKSISRLLPQFANTSRQAIEAMFEDMAARYRKLGKTQRATLGCRCTSAAIMGLHDQAADFERKWFAEGRDDASDCEACELDARVEVHLAAGRIDEAIAAAEPIVSGAMKCSEVPTLTYSWLLVPLVRRGKVGLAEKYRKLSVGKFDEFGDRIRCAGEHLAYFGLTRQDDAAGKWTEKYLAPAMAMRAGYQQWRFLLGLRLWALSAKARGKTQLPMAIPRGADLPANSSVSSVEAWVNAKCAALADAFDKRNGNRAFAQALEAQPAIAAEHRGLSFWSRLFSR